MVNFKDGTSRRTAVGETQAVKLPYSLLQSQALDKEGGFEMIERYFETQDPRSLQELSTLIIARHNEAMTTLREWAVLPANEVPVTADHPLYGAWKHREVDSLEKRYEKGVRGNTLEYETFQREDLSSILVPSVHHIGILVVQETARDVPFKLGHRSFRNVDEFRYQGLNLANDSMRLTANLVRSFVGNGIDVDSIGFHGFEAGNFGLHNGRIKFRDYGNPHDVGLIALNPSRVREILDEAQNSLGKYVRV